MADDNVVKIICDRLSQADVAAVYQNIRADKDASNDLTYFQEQYFLDKICDSDLIKVLKEESNLWSQMIITDQYEEHHIARMETFFNAAIRRLEKKIGKRKE